MCINKYRHTTVWKKFSAEGVALRSLIRPEDTLRTLIRPESFDERHLINEGDIFFFSRNRFQGFMQLQRVLQMTKFNFESKQFTKLILWRHHMWRYDKNFVLLDIRGPSGKSEEDIQKVRNIRLNDRFEVWFDPNVERHNITVPTAYLTCFQHHDNRNISKTRKSYPVQTDLCCLVTAQCKFFF